jgi:cyclic pyranopterin phosphate synthase
MRKLTHVTRDGSPRMVSVSAKPETARRAVATGRILVSSEAIAAVRGRRVAKGDPLGVATIAGIQGAKTASALIPLCHPLPITGVDIVLTVGRRAIDVTATVETVSRTGVEMEALAAVTAALLSVYDMLKAIDRGMVIESVRLLEKEGGRSGRWVAGAARTPGAAGGPRAPRSPRASRAHRARGR